MAQGHYKTPEELAEELQQVVDNAYAAARENSERLRLARQAGDKAEIDRLAALTLVHNKVNHLTICAMSDLRALLDGEEMDPRPPASRLPDPAGFFLPKPSGNFDLDKV